ncbi:MAG: excinuclease ABC subunit UvrC [Bacteroidales bacterium]|nr:excinuclease ABC subunit UvrC [Bacteroidales bacterium]
MNNDIKSTLSVIPHQPGCYQFLDEEGTVIYIGKAKNLKKRVSSYFNKEHDSPKTRILVRKIVKIKYIVVETEEDTFLLENNLIKQYQPRYNVLLKDDKTYPSIVVKKEYFPRVTQTRNIKRDGSRYFGPYTSVMSVRALLETIGKVYKVRTCRLNLSPENIKAGKFKVCLQYHIERCEGPCEGLQSLEDYNKNIDEILEILKGNVGIISRNIYKEMQRSAEELKFEEAQKLKEKYEMIENFRERSTVVSSFGYNIDVFFCSDDEKAAYINYLHVVNGSIIQAYTFEYRKKMDESKEELLAMGIVEMRQRYKSKSKEIIVPFIPDIKLTNVEFTIPQRGDKRKLLALSERNVKQYRVDKLKRSEILNPEQRSTRLLKTVQKDLQLKDLPIHIECFDNSNIQGTNPVAACVVFKKGKPSRKDYRHFAIRSVVGVDDYASMQEVIQRRYSRAVKEGSDLPQLIVIDGGKGQLSAAVEKLRKMDLYGKIPIIAIAERLEEIYFPNDSVPLYLDKNSETLKLIQYLRDEAHRFGLAYHRKKRSKAQVGSELNEIKGIGPVSRKKLLTHFKSIKRISEAEKCEIIEVLGESRGELVYNWFKKK